MKLTSLFSTLLTLIALAGAAYGQTGITPGQYEYTIKMNMQGMPASTQTVQHCLSPQDVANVQSLAGMANTKSDCKTSEVNQSSGQFAFKIACTTPQQMNGAVKGTYTPTTMNMSMDMTMNVGDGQRTMTQTIAAKRLGDCK